MERYPKIHRSLLFEYRKCFDQNISSYVHEREEGVNVQIVSEVVLVRCSGSEIWHFKQLLTGPYYYIIEIDKVSI